MKQMPRLVDGRRKKVTEADIDTKLVTGSWKRLVSRCCTWAVSVGPLSLRPTAATRSPREMSPSTPSRPIPLPPP
ncbi:hypothetical protein [Nonomuraea sp. NPDC049480]|uniref:hypothetical protein n=1 Tax=Nonomuraea sp. NPDC049480 TaxID=3364353 RepID=UPI00378E70AD